MDILLDIKREARKSPKRIVFCEPNDQRVSQSIKKIQVEKTAIPILLNESVEKNLQTAVDMLDIDEADAIISGASHPTSLTIKAAIQVGLKPNIKRISGGFLMVRTNQVVYFADCAVQIDPDVNQLAEIAKLSETIFSQLTKVKPTVALLSYSTLGSAQGDSAIKVRNAMKLLPKSNFIGEVQLDAALFPDIYERKTGKKTSSANVFIFPDLNSGNIGYKLAERLGGFKAIGPILQGVKKPINDLSRGCSVDDIVDLSALTSIQENESSNN